MSVIDEIRERCERIIEGEPWESTAEGLADWIVDKIGGRAPELKTMSRGQRSVLMDVVEERFRQDEKWGPVSRLSHGFGKWLKILMEEIGEACAAELQGEADSMGTSPEMVDVELTQAAAILVAWMEHRAMLRAEQDASQH